MLVLKLLASEVWTLKFKRYDLNNACNRVEMREDCYGFYDIFKIPWITLMINGS